MFFQALNFHFEMNSYEHVFGWLVNINAIILNNDCNTPFCFRLLLGDCNSSVYTEKIKNKFNKEQ